MAALALGGCTPKQHCEVKTVSRIDLCSGYRWVRCNVTFTDGTTANVPGPVGHFALHCVPKP